MSVQIAITSASPNLLSTDLVRTRTFYQTVLGFQEVNRLEIEGSLLWTHLVNGQASLMFQERGSLAGDLPELATAKPQITGALFLTVADVEAAFQHAQVYATPAHGIRSQPYGREFVLRDPDGYLLIVCQLAD